MQTQLKLSQIVLLLSFIQLIVGQPVAQYMMYDGNYSDTFNVSNTLQNADSLPVNFTDRDGNANKALFYNSSTSIFADVSTVLSNIDQGDFTVLIWLYRDASTDFANVITFHDSSDDYILNINFDTDIYLDCTAGSIYETIGGTGVSVDTWHQFGFTVTGGTVQVILDDQLIGNPVATTLTAQQLSQGSVCLGCYQNRNHMQGSMAEFEIYDTAFQGKIILEGINSLEEVADSCPTNTSQWNIGSDTSKRVCIHQTCAAQMLDLISFVENNLTISTNTTGLSWEDNIEFDYTISKMDCGNGSEECFIDDCFQHAVLLAEDSDYNITSIPATVDFIKPSEAGFSLPDYHNNTNCDHSANSSTCYFVMPIFYAGTVAPDAYTRDKAFIELEFTIVYSKVPGEDTISAELTSQSFGTVSHESSDVEANIENVAADLAGATVTFNETVPSEIFVGDELTLKLQAPAGHQERDFKNGTFEVDLVFTSNGTEVVIPITVDDADIEYVNDGSATPGDLRSIVFSFNANYLGTYTVRAGATLESQARRLLLEGEQSEYHSIRNELTITAKPLSQKQNSSNLSIIIVSFAIIGLIAQYYIIKNRNQKQQIDSKYQQAQIESQV